MRRLGPSYLHSVSSSTLSSSPTYMSKARRASAQSHPSLASLELSQFTVPSVTTPHSVDSSVTSLADPEDKAGVTSLTSHKLPRMVTHHLGTLLTGRLLGWSTLRTSFKTTSHTSYNLPRLVNPSTWPTLDWSLPWLVYSEAKVTSLTSFKLPRLVAHSHWHTLDWSCLWLVFPEHKVGWVKYNLVRVTSTDHCLNVPKTASLSTTSPAVLTSIMSLTTTSPVVLTLKTVSFLSLSPAALILCCLSRLRAQLSWSRYWFSGIWAQHSCQQACHSCLRACCPPGRSQVCLSWICGSLSARISGSSVSPSSRWTLATLRRIRTCLNDSIYGEKTVLVFPSEGGVAWVFQGISRGRSVTGLDLPCASLSLPGVTGLENNPHKCMLSVLTVFSCISCLYWWTMDLCSNII